MAVAFFPFLNRGFCFRFCCLFGWGGFTPSAPLLISQKFCNESLKMVRGTENFCVFLRGECVWGGGGNPLSPPNYIPNFSPTYPFKSTTSPIEGYTPSFFVHSCLLVVCTVLFISLRLVIYYFDIYQ